MKQRKGSGYIEILLSIALFSIFAIPLYGWFFYVNAHQVSSSQLVIAQAALQEKMEYYRSIEPSLLVAGTTTATYNNLPDGEIATVISEIAPVDQPYLTKIVVTISWDTTGQRQSAKTATLVRH